MMISTPGQLLAISLKPLLKPIRIWWINRRLRQSTRDVEVIRLQREQLFAEERAEHQKQVRLVSARNAIARG